MRTRITPNTDTFYDLRKTIDIVRFILTSLLHMHSLREKCPKMEFFWSVFSCIRTEYGEIRSISPYSVQMWENRNQKKLPIWALFTQWLTKWLFLIQKIIWDRNMHRSPNWVPIHTPLWRMYSFNDKGSYLVLLLVY